MLVTSTHFPCTLVALPAPEVLLQLLGDKQKRLTTPSFTQNSVISQPKTSFGIKLLS